MYTSHSFDDLLDAAFTAGKEGNIDLAHTLLSMAVTRREKSPIAWLMLAQTFTWRQEWLEAADAFTHANALEPNNPKTLCRLGHVLLRAGRLRESEDALVRALSIERSSRTLIELSFVASAKNDVKTCIAFIEEAVELVPDDVGLLIKALQQLKPTAPRLLGKLLRRACVLLPSNHELLEELGLFLCREHNYEEAEARMRLCLLSIECPKCRSFLAYALFRQGKSGEAEIEYKRAASYTPLDSLAQRMFAAFLLDTGRRDQAIDWLQRYLVEFPKDEAALQSLIRKHEAADNSVAALHVLQCTPAALHAEDEQARALCTDIEPDQSERAH